MFCSFIILILFYTDSNTGKELFYAPKGRDLEGFLKESGSHGWPSFRDEEVNWDYVRVLKDGECVSVDGTHLGHNLPDSTGNRYCSKCILFVEFEICLHGVSSHHSLSSHIDFDLSFTVNLVSVAGRPV